MNEIKNKILKLYAKMPLEEILKLEANLPEEEKILTKKISVPELVLNKKLLKEKGIEI